MTAAAPAASSPALSRLRTTLWLLALAGLAVLLAFSLFIVILGLWYPYQLDYGEAGLLWQTAQIAHGENIYKAMDVYPYIYANYTPLLIALTGPFVSLLGLTFLPGRLLIALCTLGLALAVMALARRLGAGRRLSILAGLLFLATPYVYHWLPLYRTDLLAVFFSLLAVLVAWSRHGGAATALVGAGVTPAPTTDTHTGAGIMPAPTHRMAHLDLAALLCLMGLYTKQTMVAAPLAILLTLLWQRQWRPALRFAAVMAAVGGGLFALLTILTGGGFWFGVVTSNVQAFSLANLLAMIGDFVPVFAVLILLAILGFASRRQSLGLPDAYALLAVAGIALAGKVGSWENYFLEALVVLCAYAAFGLRRLVQQQRPALAMLAPLAVALQLVLMWHGPLEALALVQRDGPANQRLAAVIQAQPGDVISEDLGLLVLNGKGVDYYAFLYTQLAAAGRWDQHWELAGLEQRRFPLVILQSGTREKPGHYGRFSTAFLAALDRNYRLERTDGGYELYVPSPLARTWDVPLGDSITLAGSKVGCAANQVSVTLLWVARKATAEDLTRFVQVEDSAGNVRGGGDGAPRGGSMPTALWEQGDAIRDAMTITPPSPLAPGRYVVRVGFYKANGSRLPTPHGDSIAVEPCVVGGSPAPADLGLPVNARFAGGITLLGQRLTPAAALEQAATLTLTWRSDAYVSSNPTIFVHVVDATGNTLAQGDALPALPMSLWIPGEVISSTHSLALPAGIPLASLQLRIGLYDPQTSARVPRSDAAGEDVVITLGGG